MSEKYTRVKLLGEGAHGKCYLCELAPSRALCVVKEIDLSRLKPEGKNEAHREAKIMASLSHPNIVKFKGVRTVLSGKLHIVMEYADGGDLESRIRQRRGRHFTEPEVLEIFVQICLGLKHMHDRKVLHRDLKVQNVFLTKQGTVKLGDFGISRVLTVDNALSVVGTPQCLSPEIMKNQPYNFKSDIWALGVLLYELCALKPPFTGTSLSGLALAVVRGYYSPIPEEYSGTLKSLLNRLLSTEPHQRPSIAQVLKTGLIRESTREFLCKSIKSSEERSTHHSFPSQESIKAAHTPTELLQQYLEDQLGASVFSAAYAALKSSQEPPALSVHSLNLVHSLIFLQLHIN